MTEPLALITGSGRGIGRAIAEKLSREKIVVVLCARSLEEVILAADHINKLGGKAFAFKCDISRSQDVETLRAQLEEIGTVSILINNAGVAPSAKLEATSDELWSETLGVNLSGAFYCSRAFVPGMKSLGKGSIINIASTAAMQGFAYTAAYTASKHGVLGLTRALAIELKKFRIAVNAVCPGFVRTNIVAESAARISSQTGKSAAEAEKVLASMNEEGRLIEPDEIADTVFSLLSTPDFTTGKAFKADGTLIE